MLPVVRFCVLFIDLLVYHKNFIHRWLKQNASQNSLSYRLPGQLDNNSADRQDQEENKGLEADQ